MFYLAQAIGVIALLIAILSFQKNTQKKIVSMQMISSVFFTVHFYLLGALSGAVLNFIGIFRAMVFRNKGQAWASSKIWLVVFCGLFIGVGIWSWAAWYSALPILGMLFTTAAFWVENPKIVRVLSACSSPCWLIYNLITRSYPGVLTELFVLSSILVAAFRYDFKKF
ncbi:MAG: YgjV family protein [Clostridia bacterium]|nr:YgjV family protein [Clostridia bacterium]